MTEATDRDRRFRNAIYILVALLTVVYLGYKGWYIAIAMDAWQSQELKVDKTGAAK